MQKILLLALTSLVVGTLATGCKTGVNVVEPARPQASYDVVPDKRIILDRSFARRLEVEFVNQSYQGDLRTVQTTVRNTTGGPLQFQYRFEWIDENGMHISSPASTWNIRSLQAGETASLTSVAPTPRAADFRFQVSQYNSRL